jgi:hypothetical protein
MSRPLPPLNQIEPDTPLRLAVAAALAYPDGSMTASGLRKEAGRGRLVIERTAGKDYTTLAAIAEMRKLCRQSPKDQGCGSAKHAAIGPDISLTPPFGSSSTGNIKRAQAAAKMTVSALKDSSSCISTANTPRKQRKAPVIPIKSPSRTS